jgi:hypothetical protein
MKFWVHKMLEISPLAAKLSVSRTLLLEVGNFYEFNEEILTLSTINVVCVWTP